MTRSANFEPPLPLRTACCSKIVDQQLATPSPSTRKSKIQNLKLKATHILNFAMENATYDRSKPHQITSSPLASPLMPILTNKMKTINCRLPATCARQLSIVSGTTRNVPSSFHPVSPFVPPPNPLSIKGVPTCSALFRHFPLSFPSFRCSFLPSVLRLVAPVLFSRGATNFPIQILADFQLGGDRLM